MARRLAVAISALLLITGSASAQTEAQSRLRNDLLRAAALERAGQVSAALMTLTDILERSPAEPGALLAMERIFRRQEKLEQTLAVVERAIRYDPSSVVARQIELRILSELGQVADLREAGERWLRAMPGSEAPYREYATALRNVGATDEAEAVLRKGRDEMGRPAALASQLADLYLAQGRWTEAAQEWLVLLEYAPGLGWEFVNFKLDALGMNARPAASALLKALADRRDVVSDRKLAAIAAIYAGEHAQAREWADDALEKLNADQRRLFIQQFADVAVAESRSELVAWAYRKLLPDVADEAKRWDLAREIVQHDLSAGDTASALRLLDEFSDDTEPGSAAHRWASASQVRLHAAQSEPKRAERVLEVYARLYENDPEFPQLALSVAEANIRSGRLDDANRVLRLVPVDAGNTTLAARMSAARGYLALYAGRYEESLSEFEVAAASLTGGERSEALRFLRFASDASDGELEAIALAHRALLAGRPLEASDRLLDRVRGIPGSSARPAMLLWAAELALRVGEIDRGERVLRGIYESYPRAGEAPIALMLLAEALATVGRGGDAIELLEALVIDYPDSAMTPLGRRRLAELKEEVPRS